MYASSLLFADRNILSFSDYQDVDLSGAKLEEDLATMINLEKSIIDEYTIIEKESNHFIK